MLLSCILWLSVGVNHKKLGGLAEFAAVMKLAVEALLPANMLGLLEMLANPVKGKWSLPLGHPLSQYACQVRPTEVILSMRVGAFMQHEYPSDIPWSEPEISAV
jgi:hypothetical protein